MNIEQKAKAYDEALNWMRELYPGLHGATKEDAEHYFPELRESEDERVIKWIAKYIHSGVFNEEEHPMALKAIDWLEKQKEQKPEHFELKAGKWYFCHHAFCCRADHLTVQEGERFMCEKDGVVKGFVIKEPEKYFIECSAPAPMEDEQKEQKPELVQQPPITYTYKSNASRDERLKAALLALLNSDLIKVKEDGYFTKKDLIEWVEKQKEPSWKPSEEQMAGLLVAIGDEKERGSDVAKTLQSIYEQLKKL